MIFATVIAFAWQGQYGALSANLFIALVIGYIFKDRIKDLLKEQLSKRFKKWIPDRRLEILRDERYHVGDCKESFEFLMSDVCRSPCVSCVRKRKASKAYMTGDLKAYCFTKKS